MVIDVDKLREDMRSECLGAAFGGGFGGALVEAYDVEKASPEELVEMAVRLGMDLSKYEVESTDRPLKKITDVLDDEAWFPAEIIQAASKLATFYLCSLAEIMRLFMPGKSGAKISCVYEANEGAVSGCYSDGTAEKMILDFLHEYGNASKNKLKKLLSDAPVESVIEKMCRRDEIRRVYNVAKKSKERFEKYICPQIEITDTLIQEKFKGKPAQQKILLIFWEYCKQPSVKWYKVPCLLKILIKPISAK